jgi:sugar phosphate isomerase/epimerase
MYDWPIGISTGSFYTQSIFTCAEQIVHGGFNMVEVCSSPAHLDYHDMKAVGDAAEMLDRLGIEPYSFHAPFDKNIDITSPDPALREHSRNEILTAAKAASLLSVRFFVIHPGPEKSIDIHPEERLTRLQNAASVLDSVAEFCEEHGISIALENMLPHLIFGNMHDMLWILGAIKKMKIGTCLDTGHAYLSGNLSRTMYKLSGHLHIVHANDTAGKYDDHLPPGEGVIQWNNILSSLGKSGFQGTIILELAGTNNMDTSGLLYAARSARRRLREMMRRQGYSTQPEIQK